VIGKVGGALTGVTVSSNNPSKTPHVYVAFNSCVSPFPNHIYDLTSGQTLPSIFNNNVIGGVDSSLQFTEFETGTAYTASETN
jgi:hypothetical protein